MPHSLLSSLLMPSEGICTSTLPSDQSLSIKTYLPTGYESNYAYPLIVLIHGKGGSDEQVLRYAQRISRRNYIYLSIRGPEVLGHRDEDGIPTYGWGDGEHDTHIRDYIIKAVEHTRKLFHVHSERIYLAGVNEGATVAYRMALQMTDKLAGVIAINGSFPRPAEGPVFQDDQLQNLRVLMMHGAANEVIPLETARRDYLAMFSAGADILLNTYPVTHVPHQNMWRDLNRWIIRNVNIDSCWDYEDDDVGE